MLKIGILIPALNPDNKLIQLVQTLLSNTELAPITTAITIVDDGSDSAHQAIFSQLLALTSTKLTILHHTENRGKGAALKTGFTQLQQVYPDLDGIATMDSDGQHTTAALVSCLNKFKNNPDSLVIGVRHFTNDIPFRSQFGNLLTSGLVRLLTHQNISDTQTGLRLIPIKYTQALVNFPGDRFEFEFDMLLQAKKYGVIVIEAPIPTIYLDGNASSHFRVVRDSLAIYSRFLKFSISGLASFVVDISLFALIMWLLANRSLHAIMIATVTARLLSAVVNYLINHHLVFDNAGEQTVLKYAALLTVQAIASGYLTTGLTHLLTLLSTGNLMPVLAKIIGDFGLFLISYHIQKTYIFKSTNEATHHVK
ncbi:glycosyl transferase [Lactobacillus sp. CBA3605]|uniref:bifunctional glycosyltransferase family 2/GtrA family protein n=1 Tax=Lactobacillus sp. CBA3605 TaxID=2099788 RepID=UPI000CFC84E9|nr:bifunctional glycosyltransferase family 2/GtrA family protein [Lactobacillus sp. CBA3605]AVK62043.1 glycosyl transferase [Lactobacillus sp. CBA3605]